MIIEVGAILDDKKEEEEEDDDDTVIGIKVPGTSIKKE